MTFKPVVIYHHIKKDYKRGMNPKEFRQQFLRIKDTHTLSFDDGLKEHYTIVFPLLKKHNIVGYFFPIAETLEGKFNHVHKRHILLDRFENDLITMWNNYSDTKFSVDKSDRDRYSFDSLEIASFKRFLVCKIDNKEKNRVFDAILKEHNIVVDTKEYYITKSELKEMSEADMVIGNHTLTHPVLANLTYNQQLHEITCAHKLLKNILKKEPTVFSYPFGSYNADTLEILRKLRYKIGFTVNSLLEIGRLDCKNVVV